ncbi:MAG: hypothetical protein JW751_05265, partial [Polyangiaceae bacterium]|nr:hypothetical protein [Polyangiaceae bacterium]
MCVLSGDPERDLLPSSKREARACRSEKRRAGYGPPELEQRRCCPLCDAHSRKPWRARAHPATEETARLDGIHPA